MSAIVKIRIEAVKQLQRMLDALPVVQPEEVTRSAAVRMLVPQVQALQSKGYTLAAIARVLGENGLPLTTVAIKTILAEATSPKKKRGRPKGRATKPSAAPSNGSLADARREAARDEAAGEARAAVRGSGEGSSQGYGEGSSQGYGEGSSQGSTSGGTLGPAASPPAPPAAGGTERRSDVSFRARTRMKSDGHQEVSAMNEGNTKRIYWIGGSKGGVGKSMLTVATLDYLLDRGERVLLVECDTSNPDVWKAYSKHENVQSELVNLDEADGWIHLVNTCDQQPGLAVVVNTAARNNTAVTQYGRTLNDSLEELGRSLVACGSSIGRETASSC